MKTLLQMRGIPTWLKVVWSRTSIFTRLDQELVVKAALPDIKPEDVETTLTGDALDIRGETKDKNYLYF